MADLLQLRTRQAALEVELTLDEEQLSLDGLLAEALHRTSDADRAKKARRRLAAGNVESTTEKDELKALIERYDSLVLWKTIAHVALFYRRHCISCDTSTEWFVGWMREQTHRQGIKARRLVKGRVDEPLPEKLELQDQPAVEECFHCLAHRLDGEARQSRMLAAVRKA